MPVTKKFGHSFKRKKGDTLFSSEAAVTKRPREKTEQSKCEMTDSASKTCGQTTCLNDFGNADEDKEAKQLTMKLLQCIESKSFIKHR